MDNDKQEMRTILSAVAMHALISAESSRFPSDGIFTTRTHVDSEDIADRAVKFADSLLAHLETS